MRRRAIALAMSAALTLTLAGEARADTEHPRTNDPVERTVTRDDARSRTDRWRGPCSGWSMGENLRAADFGSARYDRQIHRLYDCVFERWAPAYRDAFRAIVARESGWNAWAKNPQVGAACRPWSGVSFGSCGLAQHMADFWPGRESAYLWPTWFAARHVSPLDPRANLIVTARMVNDVGICPHWC